MYFHKVCIFLTKYYNSCNMHKLYSKFIITVGANHLEGTIETVWVGPMTQSEDINQSEDGQTKL